jgi:CHAT domain-containing protein
MVVDTLAPPEHRLLIGTEATKRAVVDALPWSTHAHLACHGMAVLSAELLDGGLSLASEEVLSGAEILDLPGLTARLVVASACETGIVPGYETADEALALGTIFLGAGTAGAVSSLWAVSDYATALLMSQFYERLAQGATPVAALRTAQLWLRELSATEAVGYVSRRPALGAYRGTTPPRRGADHSDPDRPFAAPTLWAAFVFTGA